jgi:hypothetical protein
VFDFKKRIDSAHANYCEEHIEQMIEDRLEDPQGNRGSDVLLMFKAKTKMPHKYREEVKIIGIDASMQMLDMLRDMALKERENRKQLEAGEAQAVEGEFGQVEES